MHKGYDPEFLEDFNIALPTFDRSLGQSVRRRPVSLRDGIYSDHTNFTVVMHEDTRQPIYAAMNVDQDLMHEEGKKKYGTKYGKKNFAKDPNYEPSDLLTKAYYEDVGEEENPYDIGHMAMRSNNRWGKTVDDAHLAGRATYVFSNGALQHKNHNRDEWRQLEMEVVGKSKHDKDNKLTVFTGPIYGGAQDVHIHVSSKKSARVPSGFFKVICFKAKESDENNQLGVLTFAIFQSERVLRDQKGSATIKTDQRYQITIRELEKLTGLKFDKKLFDANPLYYYKGSVERDKRKISHTPERVPIGLLDDVVAQQSDMRCDLVALSERKIVINSAMINPSPDQQSGEWVSLHNRGSGKTTLKNWTLTDQKGRKAIFSGSIKSGDSLRITGRDKGKVILPNRGGSLMLHDDHGCLIDHVTWTGRDLRRVERGMAYMFERGQ